METLDDMSKEGEKICRGLNNPGLLEWWENECKSRSYSDLRDRLNFLKKERMVIESHHPRYQPLEDFNHWYPFDSWRKCIPLGYKTGVNSRKKCLELCMKLNNE